MSVVLSDMLASLSAAPSDRTLRAARPADPPRSVDSHKGFSSVLQKVRDPEGNQEFRKAEDTPSSQKTDGNSQVKDTKSRDDSHTDTQQAKSVSKSPSRAEQTRETTNHATTQVGSSTSDSASASSRTVRTSDSDSSERSSTGVVETDLDSSTNEGMAHLSADAQGQVPLFMTALVASSANVQSVNLSQDSDERSVQQSGKGAQPEKGSQTKKGSQTERDAQPEKGSQTENGSPKSVPVAPVAFTAADVVLQSEAGYVSPASMVGTPQTQQQSMLNQLTTHSKPALSSELPVESPQPSHIQDTDVLNGVVNRDTSTLVATRDTSSSGVKVDALELKDLKVALEPIGKDHAIESSKGDADHKLKGLLLDQSILSPLQGQLRARTDSDSSEVRNLPLAQQGPQPGVSLEEDFREMWVGHQDGRQDQGDGKVPHPGAPEQQTPNGQRAESFGLGAQGGSVPGNAGASQGTPSISHAPSVQPAHPAAQPSLPVTLRTVVFDVAQADLGHVNIRVAMTNDVVHTYLSADRQDVGQSLISGQDRLQASLQASGFDMGQFRVDIDRQSAGRSFQQGFSQEQQGQAWNQPPSWMEGEHTSSTVDDGRTTLQGLLNVVA